MKGKIKKINNNLKLKKENTKFVWTQRWVKTKRSKWLLSLPLEAKSLTAQRKKIIWSIYHNWMDQKISLKLHLANLPTSNQVTITTSLQCLKANSKKKLFNQRGINKWSAFVYLNNSTSWLTKLWTLVIPTNQRKTFQATLSDISHSQTKKARRVQWLIVPKTKSVVSWSLKK